MATNVTSETNGSGPRRLLRNEAYQQIKQMIIAGDYEPGAFLSERQLTARLNMSKTPIRTALERLDSEGFVSISPQQGVLVRELAFHEIADLFEARLVLETYTVGAIAGKLAKPQCDSIQDLLNQQEELAEAGDIEGSAAMDLQFHLLLTKCLGNQEILRVMNQLRDKLTLVFTRHLQRNPGRLSGNLQEHRTIAESIIGGDAKKASDVMREHLVYGRDYMLSNGRSDRRQFEAENGQLG